MLKAHSNRIKSHNFSGRTVDEGEVGGGRSGLPRTNAPAAPPIIGSKKRRLSGLKPGLPPRGPDSTNIITKESKMSDAEADKKRNKLGYHRTTVACSHCRRRKIRCVPADDDPLDRCANCIRLKKECAYEPVASHPNEPGQRLSSRADSEVGPSSIASSSPSEPQHTRQSAVGGKQDSPSTVPQAGPHGFSGVPIRTQSPRPDMLGPGYPAVYSPQETGHLWPPHGQFGHQPQFPPGVTPDGGVPPQYWAQQLPQTSDGYQSNMTQARMHSPFAVQATFPPHGQADPSGFQPHQQPTRSQSYPEYNSAMQGFEGPGGPYMPAPGSSRFTPSPLGPQGPVRLPMGQRPYGGDVQPQNIGPYGPQSPYGFQQGPNGQPLQPQRPGQPGFYAPPSPYGQTNNQSGPSQQTDQAYWTNRSKPP